MDKFHLSVSPSPYVSPLHDMHMSQPNRVAKHMHAETICLLFSCQSVCFSTFTSVLEVAHNTKHLYTAQSSQIVNMYIEVHDFVLQISFCDRCQRYEKLKTQHST